MKGQMKNYFLLVIHLLFITQLNAQWSSNGPIGTNLSLLTTEQVCLPEHSVMVFTKQPTMVIYGWHQVLQVN